MPNTWPSDPGGGVTLTYKAFIYLGDLASNTYREVAPVGEMSTYSRTFARDLMVTSTAISTASTSGGSATHGLGQAVVSVKKATGESVPADTALLRVCELVGELVYRSAISGQLDDTADSLRDLLMEGQHPLYDIHIGDMVNYRDRYYPTHLSFNIPKTSIQSWYKADSQLQLTLPDDYNRVNVQLWFSDSLFRQQYDEYEIAIVPPMEGIDSFFGLASEIEGRLSLAADTPISDRLRTASHGEPYTDYIVLSFNWHDPLNEGNRIRTDWHFLVYGEAGRNTDILKEHLRSWILKHSTRNREEWLAIFPDIFRNTEFVMVPMWSQYAVPNQTLIEGIYSPLVDVQDAMGVASTVVAGEGYNNAQIVNSLVFMGNPYKSIGMVVCSGSENRPGARTIRDVWPDYINVSTGVPDFNRMQVKTQQWVNRLQQLLQLADEYQPGGLITGGFTRVRRKNRKGQDIDYIAMSQDNIQYLAVTRLSMHALFEPGNSGMPSESIPLTLLPANTHELETAAGSRSLSVNFEGLGGRAPYTYSVPQTSDMQSIAVGESTGQVEIKFRRVGRHQITVKVTDSRQDEFTATYTVNVRP